MPAISVWRLKVMFQHRIWKHPAASETPHWVKFRRQKRISMRVLTAIALSSVNPTRPSCVRLNKQLLEIKVQVDDLNARAPVDGELGPVPAETGELLNASSPLLTLVRQPQAYFVFDLREDILARVHYIAPLGDYATKRATRATGDFDLKTFEVRLCPTQPVQGLRQGMSTLWQWKD